MFPSFDELFQAFKDKFQEKRSEYDPTILAGWTNSFGRGIAAVGFAIVILAKNILKQANPLTATGLFLELWASYDNLSRLGASASIGTINVYGVNSTVIPANNKWAGQTNGLLYSNAASATIQEQDVRIQPVTILQLTRLGAIATAVSSFPHAFVAGQWITINGAIETEYNGNFSVTPDPIDANKFTYTIVGTPTSPATGSPYSAIPIIKITSLVESGGTATGETAFSNGFVDQQYIAISNAVPSAFNGVFQITVVDDTTFTFAVGGSPGTASEAGVVRSIHALVNVQSDDTGPETFVTAGGALDFQDPPIAGVETTAFTVEGLQGGADTESDEALRARLLISRSAQEGVFTNDQIRLAALLINGNTDIFIQNPNSSDVTNPNTIFPGQVRIYILRRNDPLGPVPTGGILQITKKSILDFGEQPGDLWSDDVFVLPPELLPVDIEMTEVKPDTASMRQAIKSQFEAHFLDRATFGKNVDNDILRGIVVSTQDLNSGDPDLTFIEEFNWVGVVETVADNQLPVLGVLTVNGIVVS